MALADLFPGAVFRFGLNLRRGQAADFFRITADHEAILKERRQLLAASPELYAGCRPGAEQLVAAFSRWLQTEGLVESGSATPDCLTLGQRLEPDFLLVEPRGDLR